MTPTPSEMIVAIGSSVIGSIVVKATVIAGIVLVAARWARRSRAATRHLMYAATFVVLMVLPVATIAVPSVDLLVTTRDTVVAAALSSDAEHQEAAVPLHGEIARVESAIDRASAPSLWQVLLILWAVGATMSLVPVGLGLWQVHRVRRSGLPWLRGLDVAHSLAVDAGIRRRVDVLVHESIQGPMTCGVSRAAVIFPPDARTWNDEDVRRALIHELEHVRRGDWLVQCVARIVCALYWFHPLVWISWRRLVLEAERASDDAVLRTAEPARYAEQLVTLAQRLAAPSGVPRLAMASRNDLAARIVAVLDPAQPRGRAGACRVAATLVTAVLVVTVIAPLRAVSRTQSPSPVTSSRQTFDVASIRVNTSGSVERFGGFQPGGRFRASNVPLRQVIAWAYGEQFPVPDQQIVGGPDWIDSDRFDIDARAAADTPRAEMQEMLRNLLAERFKLVSREETRQLDAYMLRQTANDGKARPRLRASSGDDCVVPGTAVPPGGASPPCGSVGFVNGRGFARAATMDAIARYLLPAVGRIVVNQTALSGTFSFDVEFAPAALAAAPAPPVVETPSIFTVLQEQLGLQLHAERASVGVLVIERVERPSEN